MMRLIVRTAALLLLTVPASAATVQFEAIANIAGCTALPNFCGVATTMSQQQSIAVGDTIDFTLRFVDGQRLEMTDLTGVGGFLNALLGTPSAFGTFTITNATGTLLGLSGPLSGPLAMPMGTGIDAHLGPSFQGFVPTGGTISFTGYRVVYDVLQLPAPATSYGSSLMLMGAAQLRVINDVAAVPESSTLTLLALGILGLLVESRRRR